MSTMGDKTSKNKLANPPDRLAESRCLLIKHLDLLMHVDGRTWVQVTHVNSPHDFYVRPICTDKDYLKSIERRASRDDLTPAVDSLVLYRREKPNWIRGRIVSVDKESNSCKVFALDYGYIDSVSLDDKMYPLAELSAKIPQLAINCSTVDCFPMTDDWEADATKAFRSVVLKAPCNIQNVNSALSTMNVRFHYPNVSMILYSTGFSSLFGSPYSVHVHSPTIRRPIKQFYERRRVSVDDRLCVTFLSEDDSQRLYVAQIDDYRKHRAGVEGFTNDCKSFKKLDIEEAVKGKPVCYFDGGAAHRACIVDSATESFKVEARLMDAGRVVMARLDQLFRLEEKYLQDAAVSMCCMLNNGGSSLRAGDQCDIVVLKVGDGFAEPHLVDIYT